MGYVFDPEVLAEIAKKAVGLPHDQMFRTVHAALYERYPKHIHPEIRWIFNNAGGAMGQMTLLHERYEPGAGTGEEMLAHKGEEGGVVVRGRIEVTVGNETRVLGPGEAYYFASNLPHRFRNPGREVCEIVSASTPPSF